MPRVLPLLALAALLALPACSDREAEPAQSPAQSPTDTGAAPPPKPIPDHPPTLPAGTTAIRVSIRGTPQYTDENPSQIGRIELRMDETLARAEVAPGDTPRDAMEALARILLEDGWTLHLEPGATPDLYLYLPPGPINLNTTTSSSVPGLTIAWSLGVPPPR